ncbi:MAG: 23S rRNA (adenine(2030)-N(6))-methyltransferase RlmJ [Gammaproteobacteria bacterium]|nr:23S rRNA (adenine(2030)-N(6))-methyltransferase RlmJ [Gammaproteobacteria bacterium]
MLSYQHEYHAGNHGDVLKHAAWMTIIESLQKKPGALRLYDTHAGSGLYDLNSTEARLNAEHATGIYRLLKPEQSLDATGRYLEVIRAANRGKECRRYPGSPLLAQAMLRPGDHLVLMELHPRSVSKLRRALGRDRRVHLHERDCFEGLPALVPPAERRGAVLIDPSYEIKDDFTGVASMLAACHARWPAGTYVVWYPMIRDRAAERFPSRVAETGIRRIWQMNLQVLPDSAPGMRGSGLLIVNPPWDATGRLESLAHALWKCLAIDGAGGANAGWLVPE